MINDIFSLKGDDAKKYGVNAAILLYHLRYWVKKNITTKKNFYDGHYWTYNPVHAFQEQFYFMTHDQVRRALEKLVEMGVVKDGCFNRDRRKRDKWYTVPDEHEHKGNWQNCQMQPANLPNAFGENAKSDLANLPNAIGENAKSYKEHINSYKLTPTDKLYNKDPPEGVVIPDEVFRLFSHFQKIKEHKTTQRNVDLLKKRLDKISKYRTIDEILVAIDNYKAALDSGKIEYIWDLWEFIGHEKAEKYYKENFKPENFQKKLSKAQAASQSNMALAQKLGIVPKGDPHDEFA